MRDGVKWSYIIWALLVAFVGAGLAYLVYMNTLDVSTRRLYSCMIAGVTAVIVGILTILSFADWWIRH